MNKVILTNNSLKMNIIKFFRKPYFAILSSVVLLFTSCTETGFTTGENLKSASVISNSLTNKATQEDVNKLYELKSYALNNKSSPQNNLTIYTNWLNLNGIQLKVSDVNTLKAVMNTNTIQQNINIAINSGKYSRGEITAITKFSNSAKNNTELTFGDVVNQFKSDINKLNLSSDKLTFYNDYFNSLDNLSEAYPNVYGYSKKMTKSCAIATAGLVVAFAALATIEVGTLGLGTGIAVAGWLLACASWGDACD